MNPKTILHIDFQVRSSNLIDIFIDTVNVLATLPDALL